MRGRLGGRNIKTRYNCTCSQREVNAGTQLWFLCSVQDSILGDVPPTFFLVPLVSITLLHRQSRASSGFF